MKKITILGSTGQQDRTLRPPDGRFLSEAVFYNREQAHFFSVSRSFEWWIWTRRQPLRESI